MSKGTAGAPFFLRIAGAESEHYKGLVGRLLQ